MTMTVASAASPATLQFPQSNPPVQNSKQRSISYQPVGIESTAESDEFIEHNNGYQTQSSSPAQVWPFCAAGLLNNCMYVIVLAVSKSISEGGVGLVYTANIVPALAVKLSAPYWFHLVSYQQRMRAAAAAAIVALLLLAVTDSLYLQLTGVAAISLQCGLGEATLLALAGKRDSVSAEKRAVSAFSSGTGLAGPIGFLWTAFWTLFCNWSLHAMSIVSLILPAMYLLIYQRYLLDESCPRDRSVGSATHMTMTAVLQAPDTDAPLPATEHDSMLSATTNTTTMNHSGKYKELSSRDRFQFVLNLWPYMVPLFAVYCAEYACQAGAWTAIGFPVDNEESRNDFYMTAAWLYQVGVFLSRSSGTCFTVNMVWLWILPGLQIVNLVLFVWVAAAGPEHWLYQQYVLWMGAFYTGLLGGAVYVHGYKRVTSDFGAETVELALAATSVAEGFGVLTADLGSLFLQSCLYQAHGLTGAVVQCPL